MVGNKVPRLLCKIGPGYEAIICFTYCKTGSGGRSTGARVGTLTLFQDQVKLLAFMVRLQQVSCPEPLTLEPD